MQCTKTVNHRASLMPWEDSIGFKNLIGNEIQLISPNLMMEYIDTPQVQGDYNDGETYYGNRIRIAIEMNKKLINQNEKEKRENQPPSK